MKKNWHPIFFKNLQYLLSKSIEFLLLPKKWHEITNEPTLYGFIACCKRCDRLGVINTVSPDRGKLWHLVSGGVCWWRETTTKCLWQEVSTLRQRQQNSILIIARSDKSVAYITDNKRLRSTFCTIEANYLHKRSITRLLCDSRASRFLYNSCTLLASFSD